jgi:RNA polymerase sigma-70 factor, ECF subfamily
MESSTLIPVRGTAMERLPTAHPSRDAADTSRGGVDESVIVVLAQRDPAAFAPLYQAYLEPVYRYCFRRLGTREAAEDATSLIFERALSALTSFHGESFRAWLFAIARNTVTDAYRRRESGPPFAEAYQVADPAPPPEQVALLADERRLLMTALALLSPDQRQVIELRLSGLPSTEVAEILDRSPEAVRALQLRATRRLQALLAASSAVPKVRHA